MKCVTLSCAKLIVPGELFVWGLCLGNIDGQSRLWCFARCCVTGRIKVSVERNRKSANSVFFVTESKVDISIRLCS